MRLLCLKPSMYLACLAHHQLLAAHSVYTFALHHHTGEHNVLRFLSGHAGTMSVTGPRLETATGRTRRRLLTAVCTTLCLPQLRSTWTQHGQHVRFTLTYLM